MSLQQARIYRRMATYHRAGIPWAEALADAWSGEPRRALAAGKPLAEALRPFVSPHDTALLAAAESSGKIEGCLERLAERHEGAARRRGETWRTLLYPAMIAHIGAVLLPLPDLMVGNWGSALRWSLALLVPTWGMLLVVRRWQTNAPGKGPPLPGRALRWWNAPSVLAADAVALRVLGEAHDAGIVAADAARIASEAGAGGRIAADLARAAPSLRAGHTLGSMWVAAPDWVAADLSTAEYAGEIGKAAARAATMLEEQCSAWLARIRAIVPTALLLLVGGFVALRVISFYAAAYGQLGKY